MYDGTIQYSIVVEMCSIELRILHTNKRRRRENVSVTIVPASIAHLLKRLATPSIMGYFRKQQNTGKFHEKFVKSAPKPSKKLEFVQKQHFHLLKHTTKRLSDQDHIPQVRTRRFLSKSTWRRTVQATKTHRKVGTKHC